MRRRPWLALLMLLMAWSCLGQPEQPQSESFRAANSIAPVADTFIRQGAANTASGYDTALRLQSSGKNRALVRFDSAVIASRVSGNLLSATLELSITANGNNWGSAGRPIELRRMLVPWTEPGATWNCAHDSDPDDSSPDCSGSDAWDMGSASSWATEATSSATISNDQVGVVAFDVTADVEQILQGAANHGWLLKKVDEGQNGHVEFGSREVLEAPRLVLSSDGPTDPTGPTDPPSETEDVVFSVVADTYVRQGQPNQNQGSETILRLQASGNNRALVKFDVSEAEIDVQHIVSAVVELDIADNGTNWGDGKTIGAYRLLNEWSELGATWACGVDSNPSNSQADCPATEWAMSGSNPRPYTMAATDTFVVTNASTGVVRFDVTADALAFGLSGLAEGWLLRKTDEGESGRLDFAARESGSGARLIVAVATGDETDTQTSSGEAGGDSQTTVADGGDSQTTADDGATTTSESTTGADAGVGAEASAATGDGSTGDASTVGSTLDAGSTVDDGSTTTDGDDGSSETVGGDAGDAGDGGDDGVLPPDPADVAPPLDPTITTRFYDQVGFLFDGNPPIQTGVDPGTIEPRRVAVLRGRVIDRDGAPLPGVRVAIKDHPEFGQTLSRLDGMYDLAVNGGGRMILQFALLDYLPVQRGVEVPWQEVLAVDEVAMVEVDSEVTVIDFQDPIQVHMGSEQFDGDGVRRNDLLFRQGTTATMVLPDGSEEELESVSVRVTEYTVGERGRSAMPADLPVSSMYTYAAEYSVDEAELVGAVEVRFDPPVVSYLDNFTGFPVGELVPLGYYDRVKGAWIAQPDGRIVRISGITNGLAELDISGGGPATASELAALGVTDAEREMLAVLHDVGDELWRFELAHFSAWDPNWGWSPPPDSRPPPSKDPNYGTAGGLHEWRRRR